MLDERYNIPLFDPDPAEAARQLLAFAAEHRHGDASARISLAGDAVNTDGESVGAIVLCQACAEMRILDTTIDIARIGWALAFGSERSRD